MSVIKKIPHLNFFTHQPEGILLQTMKRAYYTQKSDRPDATDVSPEIAYKAFADACYGMKKYADAVCLYQHVIKINPKDEVVHNRLGMLYLHLGEYDKAERAYQCATKINPECKEGHYNLGYLYFLVRRYELARKGLKAALKIDPNYARARQLWKEINRVVAKGTDALGQPHSREIVIGNAGESDGGPWVFMGTDGSISPTDTGGTWIKGTRRQA